LNSCIRRIRRYLRMTPSSHITSRPPQSGDTASSRR
jgi:hypothetical protein